MMSSFRRMIIDAGWPAERIDHMLMEGTVAAVCKWFLTTTQGQSYFLSQFGMNWAKGEPDKTYEYINDRGGEVVDIKYDRVLLFSGASIDGRPIPPSQLQISERDRNGCADCGIISHCTKEFMDPKYNDPEVKFSLCNTCMIKSEVKAIRSRGDATICDECTVGSCPHHPSWISKANRMRG